MQKDRAHTCCFPDVCPDKSWQKMWILEILDERNNLAVLQSYLLRRGSSITLGRSVEGDIVFPSDRSISRKHAQLILPPSSSTTTSHDNDKTIFLIDLKSTLGTYLNGTRIPSKEQIPLSCSPGNGHPHGHKNLIKLGNEQTTIQVYHVSYKFCSTRLEKNDKEKLKSFIKFLNGEIVKQVETCSHVLCNRFSATVKTLTAIVLQKPIVSLQWIESLVHLITTATAASSAAAAGSGAILIPNVKEFYPPGTSELTSIDKLSMSRSHLLQDCIVFFLFANDNQYEVILERCGATIISLIGIDSIDEMVQFAKEKVSTIRRSNTHLCVFYDEGRPLDTKTIHLMKRLNIPFLGSGDLATAIFNLSPPQFVTHELLSQRVSSQQSQVQASQVVEFPIPRSTSVPNTGIVRTTTLVQTERTEMNHSLCDDHEKEREDQRRAYELKREQENLENERRMRDLERQKEQKRLEQEQFERREKEKRDELKRRLELEKIEKEKREKIERDKRQQEEEKIKKEKLDSSKSTATRVSSRAKRGSEALFEENSSVTESSPLKKRRAPVSDESENLPSQPFASSNVLFEDLPLVEIENPSTALTQHQPQPSRGIVDTNGWISIDKSCTGRNCIVMESNSSMAPPTSIPRRRAINFDDPNPSSLHSGGNSSQEFPKAVVVEMKFRMKSGTDSNSSRVGGQQTSHPRDQRCFKKNVIRAILNGDNHSSSSAVSTLILKKRDMDKVLPKESEREILLHQTYESERRSLENRETLFTDGMTGGGGRGRKPRFGS